jgi:poly(hydroxyalkanoate) granule-associated protein
MAKKKKKKKEKPSLEPHRIWLAGVGAAALAEEGDVEQFEQLADRGRAALSERGTRLRKKLEKLGGDFKIWIESARDDVGSRVGQVVSEAVHRIGVPSSEAITELGRRIDELAQRLAEIEGERAAAKATGPTVVEVAHDGEQWQVVVAGTAASRHRTKAEAVKAATARARDARPCVLVVKKMDGAVQSRKAFE